MAERTIKVTIVGDASSVQRAFKGVQGSAQETESRLHKVGDRMSDLGSKMTKFATLPIAAGFAMATKASSDLSEQLSKATVVFGESSSKVIDFSKSSATALGQSQRAALEAAGTYGNLFRAIGLTSEQSATMSTRLLTLTADLASFNNASPDEVFEALRAGLVGETEPLKKFGININEARLKQEALNLGLSDGKTTLDASAKAQASYSLILKDTTLAQGDFARTSEGLANQSRILKAKLEDTAASIGDRLVPVALRLADAADNVLGVFTRLDPSMQSLVIGLAGAAAAAGPLLTVFGNLSKGASFLREALHGSSGLQTALNGLALSGAVAGLAAIFQGLNQAKIEAQALVSELNNGVDNADLGTIASALERVKAEMVGVNAEFDEYRGVRSIIQGTIEILTPLENKVLDNAHAAKALDDEMVRLQGDLVHAQEAIQYVANVTGLTTTEVERLAQKAGVDLTGAFSDVTGKLVATHEQMVTGNVRTQALSEATEVLSDKVSTAEERTKAYKDSLDALIGVHVSAEEAAIRYEEKIDKLTATLTENGSTLDISTDKGRANRQAILDTIDAVTSHADALLDQGAEIGTVNALLGEHQVELRKTLERAGLNSAEVDRYVGLLRQIPSKVSSTIELRVDTLLSPAFSAFRQGERDSWNETGDGPGAGGGKTLDRVRRLLGPGTYITSTYRTPAHNRAVGGSPTSYHLDRNNPAVDIGGNRSALNNLAGRLRAMGGWRELLWQVAGHYDHVHVAHDGGVVSSSWPTLPGLRADERPAVLQVGETVIPKGEAGAAMNRILNGFIDVGRQLSRTLWDAIDRLYNLLDARFDALLSHAAPATAKVEEIAKAGEQLAKVIDIGIKSPFFDADNMPTEGGGIHEAWEDLYRSGLLDPGRSGDNAAAWAKGPQGRGALIRHKAATKGTWNPHQSEWVGADGAHWEVWYQGDAAPTRLDGRMDNWDVANFLKNRPAEYGKGGTLNIEPGAVQVTITGNADPEAVRAAVEKALESLVVKMRAA